MYALLLALLLADPVTLKLDWGGDPLSLPVEPAVRSTDVPAPPQEAVASETTEAAQGPGVEQQLPVVPPGPVSLREAIAAYQRAGGARFYVRGKSDAQHLVEDHGWTYQAIAGLTVNEQQLLHGASHTGRINPKAYVAAPPAVSGDKPAIKIISPATWDCPHCPTHRNQDWSQFSATFERRDGLPQYPATEWQDAKGVTRRLYGVRKPSAVLWSWQHTQ